MVNKNFQVVLRERTHCIQWNMFDSPEEIRRINCIWSWSNFVHICERSDFEMCTNDAKSLISVSNSTWKVQASLNLLCLQCRALNLWKRAKLTPPAMPEKKARTDRQTDRQEEKIFSHRHRGRCLIDVVCAARRSPGPLRTLIAFRFD